MILFLKKKGSFFRKAQNWSLEMTLVLSIFSIILILTFVFLTYLPDSMSSELAGDSQRIQQMLEQEVGLIDGQSVDTIVLDSVDDLDCESFGELTGSTGCVCMYFEDLDGNIIYLDNGAKGIGISDTGVCGGTS